jgi:MTH538 TIR-like domain (DUF1863)
MSQRKKVFISFDFDQDKALKDLLIAQCMNENCPFDVIDASLKEAGPEKDWEDKAFEMLKRADTVLVLLGHQTHRAPGVLKEVKMARSLGKKVIQLIGHKDQKYRRVPGAGVLYSWTWDNLHKLFP